MFRNKSFAKQSLVAIATVFLSLGLMTGGDVFANSSNVNEFAGNYGDGCTDAGTMMNTALFVEFEDAGNGNSHVGYATDFDVNVNGNYDNLVDFNGITTDGVMKYYKDALATKGTAAYPGRYVSANSKTFDNAVQPGNFEMCDTSYAPEAPTSGQQFALNFEGGVDTASTNGDWQLNCGWSSIAGGGVRSRTFTFTGVGTPAGIPAGYTAVGWAGTATISDSGDNNYRNFGITLHYRLQKLTPANLSPDTYLSVTPGGPLYNYSQTTDRRTGVAEFYDAVIANNFGGANTTATTSSYTYAWAGGVCDRAGPWVKVGGTTVTVDSNGAFSAYPRTNAPFNRKTDNTVCHLIVIESVSAGGGAWTEKMIQATISPPTPATVTVSSAASAGTIDAQNGNVAFTHTMNISNYGYMDHNVSFVIEQSTGPLGTYACTSPWGQIGSGTQFVDRDGAFTVYGPANAAFDRNTTQQVCQRIRITDTGGANGGGTAEASAVVAAGVITPSATLNPSGIISPGEVIVITPSVAARADGGNAFPMTFNYTISTTVPVATTPATPLSVNSPVHNVTTTATTFPQPLAPVSLTIPASAPAGAKLCVNVTVTNPALTRYFTGGTPTTGDLCVIIANKPVFMVNGGDLLAGADVDTGTCTSGSAEGTIGGWNVGSPNFEGASTQLSAFAKFGITGFATAARGTQGVLPPSGLAFANIAKPSGSSYGAAFGRVPCMANQWIPATDATSISIGEIGQKLGSKAYTLTGNQILGGFTVQNGVQQVIYITGDLLITDNIRYNRTSWAELGDIPALKFVVTGNITIRNNVSVIDGVYAATGDINTCEQTVSSTYFANCANQLEVNGSLIAKGKVNLKRTYKDLRQAKNSQPHDVAEVVNYRPEVWLANWPKIDGAADNDTGYDGVTSLPPVL